MERCLEKVPEDKWEMERSPLIGQKSAANSVLVLHMYTVFALDESTFTQVLMILSMVLRFWGLDS